MTVSLSKKLLGIVDAVRGVNRAQFIRDALAEKLNAMGIAVPGQALTVPDRVKKRYPAPEIVQLNCTVAEQQAAYNASPPNAKSTKPKATKRARKKP